MWIHITAILCNSTDCCVESAEHTTSTKSTWSFHRSSKYSASVCSPFFFPFCRWRLRSWHHIQSDRWLWGGSSSHRQQPARHVTRWWPVRLTPGCEPGSRRSRCGKGRSSWSKSTPESMSGSQWRGPSREHLEHLDTDADV